MAIDKMIPQTPAEGISIFRDFGDAKLYTIPCECGFADHTHQVWIEADAIGVTVNTTIRLRSSAFKSRWSYIWSLLTTGCVEVESEIIMNRQQALNYAETLKSAIADVATCRNNKNNTASN